MHLGRKTEECLQELFVNFRAFGNGNVKELQKQKKTFVTSQPWAVRETKGRTNLFTIFLKSHLFWGQIPLSCEEGNDLLWTLLDWIVLVTDIDSDLPACEPMWMSMESRFPILFGTKVAVSIMSRYSDELGWTGAKITLWCYQNNH